ncbi:MAG: competence/damage-inducible protein A [Bacillota bacterium]
MNVEIISVGTEILLGDIVNSDAQMLSKELAKLGLNVYFHTVVGDNPKRLEEALNIAKNRAKIIITTGGLGPTYDDLTKEIIAKTFQKEMVFDEIAFDAIKNHFTKCGIAMTGNQKKQAMLPEGCTTFYNKWGTAPGCGFKSGDNHVLMLPGPPKECEPMFIHCGVPYLLGLSEGVIHSVNLKMFGIGEAQAEEILRDKMLAYTNPTIAPYAKQGQCLVRVTAKAENLEKAVEMIAPVKEEIYNLVGEYIYTETDKSLEEVVIEKLIEKNITLSCAESCTGGFISKRITDISGVSQIYMGGVCTYSNQSKQTLLGVKKETLETFGAVSEETAKEMAKGVATALGTDIGVSTTGVAGPTGGTTEKPLGLVYVCVYFKGEYTIRKLEGFRNRGTTRLKAVYTAFDIIRNLIK